MLALLFIIIALGIISEIVSLKRDPDMVELDYTISARCTEPGIPFSVRIAVTNKSRIPISYLAVREVCSPAATLSEAIAFRERQDGLHTKKVCRVKGRQRKILTSETSVSERGVHLFCVESYEFGDFLGFNELQKKVSYRREVVVYPKRLDNADLTDALGRFYGDLAAKRFLIRDPILTIGCREYTGREPMKEIHWLQSAHRGELMVREFDYNRQLSACVILGVDAVSPADTEGLDECCSTARTICELLAETGASVNFFTNSLLIRRSGREVWKCDVSSGSTGELLEGLGRVSYNACCSLESLLEYALRKNEYDAVFIVILPAGDNRGEEAIARLRNRTGQEALLVRIKGEQV